MTNAPEHHDTPSDEKPKKLIVITDADSVMLHKKLQIGRMIVRTSYISLLVLFSLLNIINENGKLALWLLQIIPLLIFVPALLRETHRTYSWLCFVALMYFAAIIPLLMSRWLWSDWLITLLVSAMFIAAMMTSRWLQYWNYYLSTKTQNS